VGLREYRKKRDFRKTPEPAGGKPAKSSGSLRFVIQKHAATRLHYDFRLEMEGALKSWAVPKGPSLDPNERRLAVEVEDHPIEYGKFEGTIPKGEYGGGNVLLWDRGTWEPEGDALRSYRSGKMKFALDGEKLHGRWTLVRMKPRDGDDPSKPNWLLIKERDEEARPGREGEIVDERPESVASGRDIEQVGADGRVWHSNRAAGNRTKAKFTKAARAAPAAKRPAKRGVAPDPSQVPKAKKAPLPRDLAPQLATLTSRTPSGDGWLFEIKLDGYRALARIERGQVRIHSRDGREWTARFPELVTALETLPVENAALDGEIVVLLPDGRSSFQELQNVLSRKSREDVAYFVFDLLHLDGYDLRGVAIEDRKALLAKLLARAKPPLRYTEHVIGKGEAFHRAACGHGLEGVIAKRAGEPYRPGRSGDWQKIKCLGRQEFVIGGFTDPAGTRKGLGALLLGVYDAKGALHYAGKVGTGFDDKLLRDLALRLGKLETKTSPFPEFASKTPRGVHWAKPELVGEVEFTGWTNDGRLRHPSFRGLREDKKPREVVRERAATRGAARKDEPAAGGRAGAATSRVTSAATSGASGREKLTHPDKVLYPDVKLTKRDLADYLAQVADRMLPLVAGRPLMLVRCPDGAEKPCFHQKNAPDDVPKGLVPIPIPSAKGGDEGTYLAVATAAGLAALVQLGTLEIHIWGSKTKDLERPERLVFDLDPGPGVSWPDVIRGAETVRDLLERLGLPSFPLVTGGKGVHVVVPVKPSAEWTEVKAFCKALVQAVVAQEPSRYTGHLSKNRRDKKIFIDYLRNGRGATAVAPYSMRARPGAPVAVPVAWSELTAKLRPDAFHVRDMAKRLSGKDPWKDYETSRASLAPVLRAARGAMKGR
jgi:bifunctional non-homologous end joining protein LigD